MLTSLLFGDNCSKVDVNSFVQEQATCNNSAYSISPSTLRSVLAKSRVSSFIMTYVNSLALNTPLPSLSLAFISDSARSRQLSSTIGSTGSFGSVIGSINSA